MLRSKGNVDHVKRSSGRVAINSAHPFIRFICNQATLIWTSQASNHLVFRHSPFSHSIECVLNKFNLNLLATGKIHTASMRRNREVVWIECLLPGITTSLQHMKRIHIHLVLHLRWWLRNCEHFAQHRVQYGRARGLELEMIAVVSVQPVNGSRGRAE